MYPSQTIKILHFFSCPSCTFVSFVRCLLETGINQRFLRCFLGILPVFVLFFTGVGVSAQTAQNRYAVVPENPGPGEPVSVGANAGAGARSAALVVDGKRLARAAFFQVPAEDGKQPFAAAVLTVPSTAKPGKAAIIVEGSAGVLSEIALDIAEREFVSETVELNAALTGLRTEPDPKKTAESDHLWSILNNTGSDVYCTGNFSPPVNSTRRTSLFGSRRVYRYSSGRTDTSIHAGIDYGIPTGTRVGACGPGKVVLARPRIVTGNSVIVEHLPGVYSLYYHLDTIGVAEGASVSTGTLLGMSGATGPATGPHLHWEIRVSGENTDPDAFISRPLLDKDAILSKISH
jgi:murein DD-endopeptidase MepM/ murein hydrolase activator NlpD